MSFSSHDIHYMRSALTLARRGLGRVAPNPAVGCVIVKDGAVIGRGRTADGGRPHAERQALAMAGSQAKGADVYVTLEPCAHHGQTGPCAEALAQAGVARVVVACRDPDPRVAGRGIAILKETNIRVEEGLCRADAEEVNQGFFLRLKNKRPLVTLKTATTLDAKVASADGQSRWITGEGARMLGYLERSQHDAIAVGINTVLADDPVLTTRLPGIDHAPVRIVFDTHLRIPDAARLLNDPSDAPVWIVCAPQAEGSRKNALTKRGVKLIEANDLSSTLALLAEEGLTRLMIEGGPILVTSFIRAGLFDRLLWFRNPSLLGAGKDAVGDLGIMELEDRLRLRLSEQCRTGEDTLEIYTRAV